MTMLPAMSGLLKFELLELSLDQSAVLFELGFRLCFESEHARGLRVGSADQSPALRKPHPDTVDIDHIIVLAKILGSFLGDDEFSLVGTVDADFRSRNGGWQVRDQAR